MSSPTEQQLRDLLAAEAAAAPRAVGLADGALRKVRRRRRVLTTCATGVLAVAAVSTALLTVGGPAGPPTQSPAVASAGPASEEATEAAETPAVAAAEAAASCVEAYSPEAVAGRSFAFDGTVTAIGPAITNRPGGELDLSAVTFRVHTWFRGGSGDTITVDMDPPGLFTSAEPAVPAYDIGTRLLVSGEPRWGGAPLDSPIAWGCGFTRSHDPQTAAAWAAATD
jgi:hypothetical protein